MDLRSGTPWWLLADGLLAAYPPLDRAERCDVAVVGAGISGALVAERLTRDGLDVVVLDARDVAMGSTIASTALLQYETDAELGALAARVGEADGARAWRLGAEAIAELGRLASSPEPAARPADPAALDCHFAPRDTVYFASRRRDAAALVAEVALRRRHGFDVELWDAADVAARSSLPAAAAIASRGGAQVDPYRLAHRLLALARRRGARVFDRTRVTACDHDAPGVTLRTDRGPSVRARRVVLAAGYEGEAYLPRGAPGARTRLRSTYTVVSEPIATWDGWPRDGGAPALLWETARPYAYLRATPDGRAIIGGLDTAGGGTHRLLRRPSRRAERLARRFAELLPGVGPFERAYDWSGTFGETEDSLPYLGAHPDVPDTFFVLAYGGNGITFSAIGAGLAAAWARGRDAPDLRLFRFGR